MKNLTWASLVLTACVVACSGATSGLGPDAGGSTKPPGSSGGGADGGGTTPSDASPGSPGADSSTPTQDDGSTHPESGSDSGGVVGATGVQIIVEPNGNKGSEIVDAINAATKSIHLTMYEMDDVAIIDALVNQSKAGKDVKIILNDFADETSSGDNTTVYDELMGDGVNVILSNPTEFTFTHEKCMIVDGATAWIMTMNFETSSPADNREYLAIDSQAADAAEAEAIFEADFANTQDYAAAGQLVVAPEPPNNSRSALVSLIDSAQSTLDIEVEEFSDTDKNGVTDAVESAAQRGVKVRLVLANATPTASQTSSISTVKSAGGSVVVSGGADGSSSPTDPYIHAKAVTVDCSGTTCTSGWVGSENMTAGSLGYNRELGIVIGNPTELAKIETAIGTDFAAGTAQ